MMKDGLGIGARKITVSTVGIVPGIVRFSQEDWQVRLSVSLHAADDELRSRLVPVNRKYPLHELRSALERYQGESGRQFTFEWTLIRGVNDREEDIKRLSAYCRGLKVSVNVIPYNPVSQLVFEAAAGDAARNFCSRLEQNGLAAVLREERGQDIDAACGQLRHRHAAIE